MLPLKIQNHPLKTDEDNWHNYSKNAKTYHSYQAYNDIDTDSLKTLKSNRNSFQMDIITEELYLICDIMVGYVIFSDIELVTIKVTELTAPPAKCIAVAEEAINRMASIARKVKQ